MIKKLKSTLANLLKSFFRQRLVAQRGASPATVSSYRDALRLFLVFASKRAGKPPSLLSLKELDRDVVLAFLDHLEQERNNSIRTRNARLAAIHSFFQHVAFSDPEAMSIANQVLSIGGKRTTKHLMGYLRQDELEAILAAPDRIKPKGRRDHALLLVLGRTGARVSEAIGVNAVDLHLQRPWQVLLRGKGGVERILPLDENTATVLKSLIDERGISNDSKAPLFVNARGQRLTRKGVTYILKQVVAIASKTNPLLAAKGISPHTLRHTVAMHMLQSGVDPATIQSWLGHASINTTHQYIEADLEMKIRALEKCDNPAASPALYQPTDEVLAMLEEL